MPDALAKANETFSLAPKSLGEAMELAKLLANSDLVPKDFRGKPGNIIVAMQMGAELGLAPMQAIQNIAVVNGRPSLWGDALLALVQAHPECEDVIETDDGETATCTVKRRGREPTTRTFSMADARTAGLAAGNVWKSYPKRMRQMRARAFALRDAFADALRGLSSAEEQRDVVEARAIAKSPSCTPPAPTEERRQLPADQRISPADYVVRAGKNAGKRLGELSGDAVAWYAENSKDEALKAQAQLELERRIAAEAEASQPRPEEPEHRGEVIDPETGEVMSGEAAQ